MGLQPYCLDRDLSTCALKGLGLPQVFAHHNQHFAGYKQSFQMYAIFQNPSDNVASEQICGISSRLQVGLKGLTKNICDRRLICCPKRLPSYAHYTYSFCRTAQSYSHQGQHHSFSLLCLYTASSIQFLSFTTGIFSKGWQEGSWSLDARFPWQLGSSVLSRQLRSRQEGKQEKIIKCTNQYAGPGLLCHAVLAKMSSGRGVLSALQTPGRQSGRHLTAAGRS